MRGNSRIGAGVLVGLLTMTVAAAAERREATPPRSDSYDELFERYLHEARATARTSTGDAWSWMNGLGLDRRARQVNDLVTIRVVESITASGSADSKLSKNSQASASVPGLFGLEKKLPGFIDPTSLASTKSDSAFKGSGATTRASELTTLVTARVAEVLPSGDLVVEGVREIEINGDRQILVLTGVVRATDVTPSNIVPSTAVGQLRIRYFGRGLMKDNLSPGWLVRVLNKVF
jgi:flagellar L-ring protein precursor FlgH